MAFINIAAFTNIGENNGKAHTRTLHEGWIGELIYTPLNWRESMNKLLRTNIITSLCIHAFYLLFWVRIEALFKLINFIIAYSYILIVPLILSTYSYSCSVKKNQPLPYTSTLIPLVIANILHFIGCLAFFKSSDGIGNALVYSSVPVAALVEIIIMAGLHSHNIEKITHRQKDI